MPYNTIFIIKLKIGAAKFFIIKKRNIFREYEDEYSICVDRDPNEYDNDYYERIINEDKGGNNYEL